jgi:hypothetical protein
MINKRLLKIKMLEKKIDNYEQLAEKMGMTKQNLYCKINEKTNWNIKDLKKLRDILNLTTDDIDKIFFN